MDSVEHGADAEAFGGEAAYGWRDYAQTWALSLKPHRKTGWLEIAVMLVMGPLALMFIEIEPLRWLLFFWWLWWLYTVLFGPLFTMWHLARSRSPARYRLTVDDGGVRVDADGFSTWMTWDYFTSFKMNANMILVYRGTEVQQWLPRAAFADEWPAVQRLVARRLGKCGRCGYLLQGSRSSTCPECGESLLEAQAVTPAPD